MDQRDGLDKVALLQLYIIQIMRSQTAGIVANAAASQSPFHTICLPR